ncbi:hypothetical protein Tco_0168411 [Tanacetum coccineum]|uniref:Uncharacterized protein n=1 Tax=Tanacetum coccineum TaxID=301880 RepID=A0ABQ5EK71_9ASTR
MALNSLTEDSVLVVTRMKDTTNKLNTKSSRGGDPCAQMVKSHLWVVRCIIGIVAEGAVAASRAATYGSLGSL